MAYLLEPTAAARPYFMEGMFHGWNLRRCEKGGAKVGKTKKGKGTKLMVIADGRGIPLGIHIDSASPSEVKLVDQTLATVRISSGDRGRPGNRLERLIADRGYDSDPLRKKLRERGIEPIIPHRENRKKPPTQDGRGLRRYARRWIIERTNAWLQNFRRLVVRYERSVEICTGLVHLACALITLRRVLG
jgi:transposase